MLRKIMRFIDKLIVVETLDPEAEQKSLQLALAALLIEVMTADRTIEPAEQERVRALLQSHFALPAAELAEIIQLAEAELHQATDYYQFTSRINQSFELKDKIKVVEYLWEIAYADESLDCFEEHFIRKVADLLFVSHSQFIRAKLKTQEKLSVNKSSKQS